MNGFIWIFAAVFGLVSLVVFCLSFVPRYQEWVAERVARSVALILTPEVLPMVRKRVAWRMRGTTLGSFVGMLVGLAVMSHDSALARLPLSTFLFVGTIFAGASVGVAAIAAVSGTQRREDEVRFARAEATSLSDYVAPIERNGARFAVALAAAIILVSVILSATGRAHFTTPLSLTSGGTLGVLAIAGFTELSHALAAAGAHPTGMLIVANIGLNAVAIAVALIVIFVAISKPQRYFRLRLWPDLAEGL